ncbi:SCO6880 family protein [Nocardioides marmoraquaticus]
MATTYTDYSRDKIGWFFGLSGPQLAVLAIGVMPVLWSVKENAWLSAGLLLVLWSLIFVITVVPVRGRSATGWLAASIAYALGGLMRWTSFGSRAAAGAAEDLAAADLPGVLQGVQIHDGPPHGPALARVAVIQNHATKTWAVTAAIVHPGIGMAESDERARLGQGLTDLLDLAARTELIDEVLFTVRTVPEDGAERDLWVQRHRRANAPALATQINEDLARGLTQASVRTEAFVTIVVPETRIAKEAKESGGGFEGRARTLYLLMGEVEAQLRGGMAMTAVSWLTSPQLALACRTGFAPSDRVGIIDALAAAEKDPTVNAEVPWAMAGPSGADPVVRHYSHDAWNSISSTIKLPDKGAAMGALAPVLTPGEPGERRSFMVAYPILRQSTADRQTANSEWAADLGSALRAKAGVRMRAKQREEAAKAHGMDYKLARGNSMTRPYAVCTVTVPKTARVTEFGRRLDAAVRRAGFAPLRLDLAQDAGFAASAVPLGVSLTRKGDA